MSSIVDVSVALPSLTQFIEVITLRSGFNSTSVILGTTFLGVAAGVIGTYSLLRKRALVGDALAHCTLPGLAGAFLLAHFVGASGKSLSLLLFGATISGILGVLTIQALTSWTRIKEDAAIGAVLSCFFGFGIVLISLIQELGAGGEGGLTHFIYGQTAAISRQDSFITLMLAIFASVCALLFTKEFRLVCFDHEYAAAQGWPVGRIDLLLMTLVVLVTVIGLQSVGLLLIIALLIIPPCTARFWTEKLRFMVPLAAVFGGLSGYLGAVSSALFPRLPAGAIIVLIAGAFFLLSFLLAPERGLLAGALRLLRLRLRIAVDHLLREIYEELEPIAGLATTLRPLSRNSLFTVRSWSPFLSTMVFLVLKYRGLIINDKRRGELSLTPRGLTEATKLIRNHRLWEEFLLSYGRVAANHVDYSADLVEHVLSPSVVERLLETLRAQGRLPEDLVPLQPLPSAHPTLRGSG